MEGELHVKKGTAVFVARLSGSNCPRVVVRNTNALFRDDFHKLGIRAGKSLVATLL